MSDSLAEHYFRHSYSVLVASLCRQFGTDHLELIEDAVQSALLEAMQRWRKGAPDKPTAWLKRVARNRMLDHFRHQQVIHQAEPDLHLQYPETDAPPETLIDERGLSDEVLRLMFVVCHPALGRRAQIMLALKHLCGFSNDEIARGLLMSREAIKKQLQRAAKQLRELQAGFDLPAEEELSERIAMVHRVLYMVFSEGYSSASAEQVIREDVCAEAARMTHLLATHPLGTRDTRALLALMMLHAARLPARVDMHGNTILLAEQDRTLWDKDVIREAASWLQASYPDSDPAGAVGRYQLEALIAFLHCKAARFEETPWAAIVQCYDALIRGHNSLVYRVNRAIAIALHHGTDDALRELDEITQDHPLYPSLACARAWLLERAGRQSEALTICEDLLKSTLAPHEQRLIEQHCQRLRHC